jgi:hypothetical protein
MFMVFFSVFFQRRQLLQFYGFLLSLLLSNDCQRSLLSGHWRYLQKKMVYYYLFIFFSNFYFFLGMGSSGLWLGFEAIGKKDASGGLMFVGVLMVIIGVGWGLAALADFYLLAKVRILLLFLLNLIHNCIHLCIFLPSWKVESAKFKNV